MTPALALLPLIVLVICLIWIVVGASRAAGEANERRSLAIRRIDAARERLGAGLAIADAREELTAAIEDLLALETLKEFGRTAASANARPRPCAEADPADAGEDK
ncbi:hypothetical protein FKB34_02000 [Glycocaulis profundi]|nr:hypothetical protein FKB34_02000 [Glycocaulis profundi]